MSLEAHAEPLVHFKDHDNELERDQTLPSFDLLLLSPIRLNLLKFLLHTVYIFICILTAFMLQKTD